jgi:glycolate oxidase FAD binding subunit
MDSAVIAKISVLPAAIATMAGDLQKIANSQKLQWQMVVQATGVGMLRLDGETDRLSAAVEQLRAELEGYGGSLVILQPPWVLASLEAWGNPGDALPLMRAVKQQLDPKGTVNPGRFVGGI